MFVTLGVPEAAKDGVTGKYCFADLNARKEPHLVDYMIPEVVL